MVLHFLHPFVQEKLLKSDDEGEGYVVKLIEINCQLCYIFIKSSYCTTTERTLVLHLTCH